MQRLSEICRQFWGARVQYLFVEKWSVRSIIFFRKREWSQQLYSGGHGLYTFTLSSWPEPEVVSNSGSNPPAAAAYMRKNRKDIWDGSMPNTVLLHSPICSFSSDRKEWLNMYFSSHTHSNDMHLPVMTVFCKVEEHYIGSHHSAQGQMTVQVYATDEVV